MEQALVVIRDAEPTYDEGLSFAHYINIAAEGAYRYALGRRFGNIVATAFALPGHDLSHENTVFAELNGIIVGMASGYTAEQHTRSSDIPLRQAPGNRAMRTIGLWLIRVFYRIFSPHAEGDYYLHFLAVDEDFRGRGVGSALLDFMETRARAGGSARFSLDVSARNAGARRLYARRGLTVESTRPNHPLLPRIVNRMVKAL